MNQEIVTPGVPELSEAWIALRTQHLMEELTSPSPQRKRRFILGGVGSGALAVAALIVGLVGPWASPAFAGWSAQPTSPSSDQLSAAETACAALATNLAGVSNAPDLATLPSVSLSDVRGPYSLIVYGTTNPALCVAGANLTSLHDNGGTISLGSSGSSTAGHHSQSWANSTDQTSNDATPTPDGAVVNLSYMNNQDAQAFTVVEGSVGSHVSGATLLLSDGSSVVSTVKNGLFAAWWPGEATVSSTQATTDSN
jgi:hypothetical protein